MDLEVPWAGLLLLILALGGWGIWILRQKREVSPMRTPPPAPREGEVDHPGFVRLSTWERSELTDAIVSPEGAAVQLPNISPERIAEILVPVFTPPTEFPSPVYMDAGAEGVILLFARPPDPRLLLDNAVSWACSPTICTRLPRESEYFRLRPGSEGTWVGVSEHGQRVVWDPLEKRLLRKGPANTPYESLHARINPGTARVFKC